jgi:hypothetical protein
VALCVNHVDGFGHEYWSVNFSDSQGDLAQLASQTEVLGRCLGFCRTYELTSGNANGQNVNPENTAVIFQVENNVGSLTIISDYQESTFRIVAAEGVMQPGSDSRFVGGQTVSGKVNGNPFQVTLNQSQTLALLARGGLNQVLRYNANPTVRPRCLCKVYESGSTSIAVEFHGNQAVGAYWQ